MFANCELVYVWQVIVKNGGNNYEFGFMEWGSMMSSQQKSGDLAALIAAGEATLWRISSGGNGSAILGAGVSVEPAGENVVISIRGKENVERVFSSRPEKVQFRIQELGQDLPTQDAVVNYKK